MDSEKFAKDGGWLSRKLAFGFVSQIIVVLAAWLCPAAVLPEVIAGIVAVYGVFATGNVVTKWTVAKNMPVTPTAPKITKIEKPIPPVDDLEPDPKDGV